MAEAVISSKNNQYVKLVRSLADKKQRRASGLFVAEGLSNVREAMLAANPAMRPELLLYAAGRELRPEAAELVRQAEAAGARVLAVRPDILQSCCQTETSQGLLLALHIPQLSAADFVQRAKGKNLAVLDGLQDPGNVGTILRTAWAAGLGGVLLVNDCADVFSPKVVRAAMGAVYHLPSLALDSAAALEILQQLDCELVCADAAGRDFRQFQNVRPVAWLLGNEAAGPSNFWRSQASKLVAIPMQAGVDSLNVAVAAGILFFAGGQAK